MKTYKRKKQLNTQITKTWGDFYTKELFFWNILKIEI